MATTKSSKQLYPFSTEDSKAIPLDIIRPLALLRKAVASGAIATLAIPASWSVASFFSPTGCIVQFAGASLVSPLVDGTEYLDTLLVPPSCIVTATVIPGDAKILGLGAASYLIIQQMEKWAGLALQRQLSNI